ncbi:MAG: hypothetical protein JSU65_06715 [Candidatus Zixiibacteriota bacterium]|nr:MAG: hypothetical protein JSU65_06715 [candidate division Zixibacteria bacterium]
MSDLSLLPDDASSILWLLVVMLVLFVWGLSGYIRTRRMVRLLRGLVGSLNKPLLFYDENDRLVFHTAGLILLDRKAVRSIKKLGKRPPADGELTGELQLDHNTYRYSSRQLEYLPGRSGTIVFLEYLKHTSVSQ